jgi:hypothetical protein
MTDSFSNLIALNGVAVWLIQFLKNASWFPWLTREKDGLLRLASALTAAAGSAGIVVTHHGPGEWGVTGATLPVVGAFLWHALANYITQKVLYHTTVNLPQKLAGK